jgi:hypothetical protein
MTVQAADTHAHVQRLVSVVKMATVLEVCTAEEQRSFVLFFFVGKRTQCKGYAQRNVSCLRWEVFGALSGSQLGSRRFADDEEIETEVWKWRRQQSKGCGFRRTGKCINAGGGYVEK